MEDGIPHSDSATSDIRQWNADLIVVVVHTAAEESGDAGLKSQGSGNDNESEASES